MRIIHVQGVFSPEHGGPAHSLANYCKGQAKRGHRVSAWALEGFPRASPAIRLPPPIEMMVHRVEFPHSLGRSRSMRQALALAENPDVIHLHGTWLRAMHYGAREAQRRRIPYMVELMGMYEPYGLRTKWLRKRVARRWFQDEILKRAQCLHVSSSQEGENLRQLGFQAPLAVIPVGVDIEAIAARQHSQKAPPAWPDAGRCFLYLSRIHEKKGIELLLRAWAALAARFPDWHLVIAGTGSSHYVERCRQLSVDSHIEDRCSWLGHLTEDEKNWALSRAEFFVLPSFSENFGNAVAEALAHGAPVLTTDKTPWKGVLHQHCGWIASPSVASLLPALELALGRSPAELKEMGDRGRIWCEAEFSLAHALDDLEAVYSWITGTSAKPDCVIDG